MNELFEIYKRNFPFIVRADDTAACILENKSNKIIAKRNKQNQLIGVSVINKNTIILLCVDTEYRNKGIGAELLKMSEKVILEDGYNEITVGAGFDYIMPGIPTSKGYFKSENENLYSNINETACCFFTKRGYSHSWGCDCFDMRLPLKDFNKETHSIGDTIDGISYRWASLSDLDEICKCTDDAYMDFTKYYKYENLYNENSNQKVLIAVKNNEVAGTLIVSIETEGAGLGSVGCTTVKHSCQGKHIAVNLVILGTKYLRDIGMREAFLGYTYTGLDHLYGYAGYKICIYYMMAKKEIADE